MKKLLILHTLSVAEHDALGIKKEGAKIEKIMRVFYFSLGYGRNSRFTRAA
jgi:hypothetical protein